MKNKEIKAEDLIKWSSLSLLLSGSDNSIRKHKQPNIYKEKGDELKGVINKFIDKNK